MQGRTVRPRSERPPEPRRAVLAEDVLLRNYDGDVAHDVGVTVSRGDAPAFDATYRLAPGETKSVADAAPSGSYDVEVRVDDRPRDVSRCRLGDDPPGTILVEIGNGVVSVTNGTVPGRPRP